MDSSSWLLYLNYLGRIDKGSVKSFNTEEKGVPAGLPNITYILLQRLGNTFWRN